MKEFIMLMGLPGCGKSTFAKKLAAEGYHICSSDAIREETGLTDNDKVFRILHGRVISHLKSGENVIYDATNLSRRRRLSTLKEFRRSADRMKIVCFAVPLPICREQNRMRDPEWIVPEEVQGRMVRSFNAPGMYEGWDEIAIIRSEKPYEKSVDMHALLSVPQDNPHHTLTIGEHLLSTEAYLKTRMADWRVCEAGRYHDIGKMLTKQFLDSKGNPSRYAHFYSHENVSAYLFLSEISTGYDPETVSQDDILYITNLINWHMRPLHIWDKPENEAAKEKDFSLLGEQMVNDILLLHEADLSAH